jgi:uncharacterized protein YutE (UPF0331/DUF86 family)/predicted nucleotidyltransferase
MAKFLKSKEFVLLKKYFEKEPSVLLAFLFGSFAKGVEMKESDFDVAVYLTDKKKRDKIWADITDIVEKEVDLICINDAPAILISDIFKTGIPLSIKDEKLYWELYLEKSLEAEDFCEFIEDFLKIKQKAKSLTNEVKARLERRIDFLKDNLREWGKFKKLSFKEYTEDRDKRRNIERWVENIINALIDIAKITLASEKKEMPRDYKETLLHFGFFIGLKEEKAKEFSKLADLRNILAHEYLEVLYERIKDFIKEFPKLYPKIFKFLKEYLKDKK